MKNPSLGTCKRHGARYTCVFQDALSFPEANTTASQRGQGENEVMSPLGSALGSPQIAAGWGGQLDEGASSWGGQLDEGASSCSNVEQSLEGHSKAHLALRRLPAVQMPGVLQMYQALQMGVMEV